MADIVRYHNQIQIEHTVRLAQTAHQELSRIRAEGARLAIETLTDTTARIEAAAASGMSAARIAELVAEQKAYLFTMQRIANQGTAGLQAVLNSLPALPDNLR
jgi:uncharacterized radical SAM superfamily Fe-S cluster-containing enzyme